MREVRPSVVIEIPSRGPLWRQLRQIDTWLWPARSPALGSPEATRTVRSKVSSVSSAIGVPVEVAPGVHVHLGVQQLVPGRWW